jgi:hypothetical protein
MWIWRQAQAAVLAKHCALPPGINLRQQTSGQTCVGRVLVAAVARLNAVSRLMQLHATATPLAFKRCRCSPSATAAVAQLALLF